MRVAGRGSFADGSTVTWVIADGRRGRRWREVVARDDTVVHALLLETDPAGRFSHLELARADGLWTLHPESDGTLHGNHVGGADPDVRHIVGYPFAPDDAVVVEGSPVSLAALAWGRAPTTIEGGVHGVAGVLIGADGRIELADALRIERVSRTRWRIGEAEPFEIDDAGLPILVDGSIRPLEQA